MRVYQHYSLAEVEATVSAEVTHDNTVVAFLVNTHYRSTVCVCGCGCVGGDANWLMEL